jgi:hypothetical protein
MAKIELIEPSKAAGMLGVSISWIERGMNNGDLPFSWYPLSPRKRMLNRLEIEAWLNDVRIPAATVVRVVPKRRGRK